MTLNANEAKQFVRDLHQQHSYSGEGKDRKIDAERALKTLAANGYQSLADNLKAEPKINAGRVSMGVINALVAKIKKTGFITFVLPDGEKKSYTHPDWVAPEPKATRAPKEAAPAA